MARVVVTAALRGEVRLEAGELEIDAASLFDLVRRLDAISPGLESSIQANVAIAVDGALVTDWSIPLTSASEVLLVPYIAGGQTVETQSPPRSADPSGGAWSTATYASHAAACDCAADPAAAGDECKVWGGPVRP